MPGENLSAPIGRSLLSRSERAGAEQPEHEVAIDAGGSPQFVDRHELVGLMGDIESAGSRITPRLPAAAKWTRSQPPINPSGPFRRTPCRAQLLDRGRHDRIGDRRLEPPAVEEKLTISERTP